MNLFLIRSLLLNYTTMHIQGWPSVYVTVSFSCAWTPPDDNSWFRLCFGTQTNSVDPEQTYSYLGPYFRLQRRFKWTARRYTRRLIAAAEELDASQCFHSEPIYSASVLSQHNNVSSHRRLRSACVSII